MRIPNLILALPLLFAACGGTADSPKSLADSGSQALGARDYEEAQADFSAALKLIGGDAKHPEFLRASLGGIEAEAHLNPERAHDQFMALAGEHKGLLKEKDYATIAGVLMTARAYKEAAYVADAGAKAFPASKSLLAIIDRIREESTKSGDAAGLEALQGLGYVGD